MQGFMQDYVDKLIKNVCSFKLEENTFSKKSCQAQDKSAPLTQRESTPLN